MARICGSFWLLNEYLQECLSRGSGFEQDGSIWGAAFAEGVFITARPRWVPARKEALKLNLSCSARASIREPHEQTSHLLQAFPTSIHPVFLARVGQHGPHRALPAARAKP